MLIALGPIKIQKSAYINGHGGVLVLVSEKFWQKRNHVSIVSREHQICEYHAYWRTNKWVWVWRSFEDNRTQTFAVSAPSMRPLHLLLQVSKLARRDGNTKYKQWLIVHNFSSPIFNAILNYNIMKCLKTPSLHSWYLFTKDWYQHFS